MSPFLGCTLATLPTISTREPMSTIAVRSMLYPEPFRLGEIFELVGHLFRGNRRRVHTKALAPRWSQPFDTTPSQAFNVTQPTFS